MRTSPTSNQCRATVLDVIKGTVLIVEDDVGLRTMFRLSFHRDGFKTVEAGDVRTARRLLEAEPPPDIVLLDIGLPREDGYVLLSELKGDPRTAAIPTIVMTGYSPFAHHARCIAAGASEFFQKPVDLADLRGAIGRSLRVS